MRVRLVRAGASRQANVSVQITKAPSTYFTLLSSMPVGGLDPALSASWFGNMPRALHEYTKLVARTHLYGFLIIVQRSTIWLSTNAPYMGY